MPYKDPLKRKQASNKYNQENREMIRYARGLLKIPLDKRRIHK